MILTDSNQCRESKGWYWSTSFRMYATPARKPEQNPSVWNVHANGITKEMTTLLLWMYSIVGNFQGRKLWQISQFCGYSRKFSPQNLGMWRPLAQQKQAICELSFLHKNRIFHKFTKVFSTKFGDVASFGAAEASNLRKFLHKNRIFHQFAKVFFFESFPLYGILG